MVCSLLHTRIRTRIEGKTHQFVELSEQRELVARSDGVHQLLRRCERIAQRDALELQRHAVQVWDDGVGQRVIRLLRLYVGDVYLEKKRETIYTLGKGRQALLDREKQKNKRLRVLD